MPSLVTGRNHVLVVYLTWLERVTVSHFQRSCVDSLVGTGHDFYEWVLGHLCHSLYSSSEESYNPLYFSFLACRVNFKKMHNLHKTLKTGAGEDLRFRLCALESAEVVQFRQCNETGLGVR